MKVERRITLERKASLKLVIKDIFKVVCPWEGEQQSAITKVVRKPFLKRKIK